MKITSAQEAARLVQASRVLAGITQQQLAERVGVTRQTIARIEHGNGGASIDTYLAVFKELNITLIGQPQSRSDDTSRIGQPKVPERNWVIGLSQKLSEQSKLQASLTERRATELYAPITGFLATTTSADINEAVASMLDLHLGSGAERLLTDHQTIDKSHGHKVSEEKSDHRRLSSFACRTPLPHASREKTAPSRY